MHPGDDRCFEACPLATVPDVPLSSNSDHPGLIHRSPAAPVWKIPNETLGEILEWACCDYSVINSRYHKDVQRTFPQFQLGAVCQLWRSVLRKLPDCWAKLTVAFAKNNMPRADLLHLFLDLSKQ
ncbi:hypothetical protein D9757_007289 [Collybiopsis confluens]|uniref:F-box domain-containing protein n=1 Tax=Collybiopsis confluens TaxID=2823264 RepID=A0A8H5HGB4_9AGAR|nr:hypothetical protein D9757_007289 [Collybiopsis confluens]